MHEKHSTTFWPYYFLVVSLFVLSLIAPSNWKQPRRPTEQPLAPPEAMTAQPPTIGTNKGPLSLAELAEPVQAEPVQAESVQAESVQAESIQAEPAKPPVAARPSPIAKKVTGLEPELSAPIVTPEAVPLADTSRAEHVATRTRRPRLGKTLPSIDELKAPDLPPLDTTPLDADPADKTLGQQSSSAPRVPLRAIPKTLLDQLVSLQAEATTQQWATDVLETVEQLTGENSNVLFVDPAAFEKLVQSIDQVEDLLTQAKPLALKSSLRRTRYALQRRQMMWQMAAATSQPDDGPLRVEADPNDLASALASVRGHLGDSANGRNWGDYLLLSSLDQLADRRASQDLAAEGLLAERVLSRLADARRGHSGTFVDVREIDQLDRQLRKWVVNPIDSARLLSNVEHYEQTRLPSDARLVAVESHRLGWSEDGGAQTLSKYLNTHYRNANLRIAINKRFLNRLLPQSAPQTGPFQDVIDGNAVHGRQARATHVSLEMTPNARQISMDLKIVGNVNSDTVSESGPAIFHTRTKTNYYASKRLVFNGKQLLIGPATAYAVSHPHLYDVATDFDVLPLFGDLAREFARSQHNNQASRIRQSVERKAADQARRTFDAKANPRLRTMMNNARIRLGDPIGQLGLVAEPIQLSSDKDRAVARYRLAGTKQLGAHTPRPRAPSDSLVSLQLHESAINNVLENFQFNGRTYELCELYRFVAERLGKKQIELPEGLPQDVQVTFADQDAVHCRFEDGTVVVTLRLAEIATRRRHWHGITVHARYAPEIDGLDAHLVRTTIRISGHRLSTRSNIAVRAIFGRMFTRNNELPITPRKFIEDPRLADLEVTQAIVADGWVGLAIGPQRTTLR